MIIFAFLFFFTSFVMARDVEETFLRANKYYQENKLVEAKEEYEKINNKGTATWYNLGNCHYKLDDHINALVCWRRAQQQAVSHELDSIAYNIDVVEDKLGKHTEQTWYTKLEHVLLPRSLFMLQALFLIFWYLLFVCMRWYKRGMHYKTVALALLFVFNAISISALVMKYQINARCQGIVVQQKASLFAGPDEHYHVVSSVDCADEVIIQEQRENWCKVKYKDTVGWLQKSSVASIG